MSFFQFKKTLYILGLALLCFSCCTYADPSADIFSSRLFEHVEKEYGQDARERIERWQKLILNEQNELEKNKLRSVNSFFNRISFKEDITVWQKNDYWATPVEFLSRNSGDCEDFTIAKYFTLRALNIPSQKLRLMYVRALRVKQSHMVLAYFEQPDGMPLILDNLNGKILPANYRRDLKPIYSLNINTLWGDKAQGRGRKIKTLSAHSTWQSLINKIERGQ